MDIDKYLDMDNPERWTYLRHGQRVTWGAGIAWRDVGFSLGGRMNKKYNDDKTLEIYWQFLIFYGEFHVELDRHWWGL